MQCGLPSVQPPVVLLATITSACTLFCTDWQRAAAIRFRLVLFWRCFESQRHVPSLRPTQSPHLKRCDVSRLETARWQFPPKNRSPHHEDLSRLLRGPHTSKVPFCPLGRRRVAIMLQNSVASFCSSKAAYRRRRRGSHNMSGASTDNYPSNSARVVTPPPAASGLLQGASETPHRELFAVHASISGGVVQ